MPLCLLLALLYWGGAQWYYAAQPPTGPRFGQTAIEDVELHNRLAGYNPLAHDTDRDVPEPTPETHREVRLEQIKADGSLLRMRFSRSLAWIEAAEAQSGSTVWMDLPEFGAVGEATVVSIGPCPAVPPGPGNLVTGIFRHQATNVIDLYLEGANDPIGCTDNHRFWSEDREDYVEASELRHGEKVWTQRLGITTVNAAVPRPGLHHVWNLEVHGEHVYEVGDLGVLVHNNYDMHHTIPRAIQKKLRAVGNPNAKHRDIVGRPGLPNRRAVDRLKHRQIHSGKGYVGKGKDGIGGGHYNNAFDKLLKGQGDYKQVTPDQVLEVRDFLVRWFDL